MITAIIRNAADTTRVEVKVDIFAKIAELQTPGFDTRFTNMEIQDSDAAIALGINLTEIENNFQSLVALATGLGLGLYVIDLNASDLGEVEIVAPV